MKSVVFGDGAHMSGEGDEYRAFSSIFRLPSPDEVIPPVDPAHLKVIIQASLTARKLHPQTDVGFDLRFLQQQFGKDPTNLFALWIRSSARATDPFPTA